MKNPMRKFAFAAALTAAAAVGGLTGAVLTATAYASTTVYHACVGTVDNVPRVIYNTYVNHSPATCSQPDSYRISLQPAP